MCLRPALCYQDLYELSDVGPGAVSRSGEPVMDVTTDPSYLDDTSVDALGPARPLPCSLVPGPWPLVPGAS